MPDSENEDTTMWVKRKTVARMRGYEEHRRQSNDEILNWLMDQVEPPKGDSEA